MAPRIRIALAGLFLLSFNIICVPPTGIPVLRLLAILALLIPAEPAFAETSWFQRLLPPGFLSSGKSRPRSVRLPKVPPLPRARPDRAGRGDEAATGNEVTAAGSDALELKPAMPAAPERSAVVAAPAPAASDGAGSEVRLVPTPPPRPLPAETASGTGKVAKATDVLSGETGAAAAETVPSEDKVGDLAPSPTLSACRLRLTPDLARAPSAPDIDGPGACGAHDMVQLEAVVLPDKSEVRVRPPAIIRCTLAEKVALWVRNDVVPAAAAIGADIRGLENYASYDCRGRNRVVGAKLSEHGKGNALDVRAFRLAGGKLIAPTDPHLDGTLRAAWRKSACANFTTVLGPGSDGYHESHIHIDLAARHNGYRLCQWDIRGPGPVPSADVVSSIGGKAVVPLPRARPTRAGDRSSGAGDKGKL